MQQFFGLKKRLPVGQSGFLTALRALVYGVLIFFLLGPALIDKRVTKLRRPLTVLIDSSQSMGFPASSKSAPGDKNAKSRLDLVREKLTAGASDSLLQKLNRDYDLKLIRLGTSLEPISSASLAGLKPQDPGTRLLELLQTTARDSNEAIGGHHCFHRRHHQRRQEVFRRRAGADRAGICRRRRRGRRVHRRAHR